MPTANSVTPELMERLVLEGLEAFCKVLWTMTSKELKDAYPQYRVNDKKFWKEFRGDFINPNSYDPEVRVGVQAAFDLLSRLDCMPDVSKETAKEPVELTLGRWMQDISFLRCRLGVPASLSDVKYYFRQEVARRQAQLREERAQLRAFCYNPEPALKWALRDIEMDESLEKRFEELHAPSVFIEAKTRSLQLVRQGHVSTYQLAAAKLRANIHGAQAVLHGVEGLLRGVEEGNFARAIEHLALRERLMREHSANYTEILADWGHEGEYIDFQVGAHEAWKSSLAEWGEKESSSLDRSPEDELAGLRDEDLAEMQTLGTLSKFIRMEPDGEYLSVSKNLILSGYYLYTSLLQALTSPVGQA